MGWQSVMLYAAGDRCHDDSGTMAITYVVLNNQHRSDASLLGAAHRFKIRIEYVSRYAEWMLSLSIVASVFLLLQTK